MNSLYILLGSPSLSTRNGLEHAWTHICSTHNNYFLVLISHTIGEINYLCVRLQIKWDVQNVHDPTYQKVHSNVHFLLPLTATFVFFTIFSHMPSLKIYSMFNWSKNEKCLIVQIKLTCSMGLWMHWISLCFFPQWVEHYKFAKLHTKYVQNPMKHAHIDIQAYIHALDLTFM